MIDKLKAFKDKVVAFVDEVKADPKKQLLAVGVAGFVIGFAFAKLF